MPLQRRTGELSKKQTPCLSEAQGSVLWITTIRRTPLPPLGHKLTCGTTRDPTPCSPFPGEQRAYTQSVSTRRNLTSLQLLVVIAASLCMIYVWVELCENLYYKTRLTRFAGILWKPSTSQWQMRIPNFTAMICESYRMQLVCMKTSSLRSWMWTTHPLVENLLLGPTIAQCVSSHTTGVTVRRFITQSGCKGCSPQSTAGMQHMSCLAVMT
mmetsp:Transcript_25421/g.30826  ORF Transcript_25421/g.30826 Transcript_25421/m.30826 type:complete len:212 (-) Transcript_25421:664-1299(-)